MKCQLPSLRRRWGFGDSHAITFLRQAGVRCLSTPHSAARSLCGPGDGAPGSGEGDPRVPWSLAGGPPSPQGTLSGHSCPCPSEAHSSHRWRPPRGCLSCGQQAGKEGQGSPWVCGETPRGALSPICPSLSEGGWGERRDRDPKAQGGRRSGPPRGGWGGPPVAQTSASSLPMALPSRPAPGRLTAPGEFAQEGLHGRQGTGSGAEKKQDLTSRCPERRGSGALAGGLRGEEVCWSEAGAHVALPRVPLSVSASLTPSASAVLPTR